MTSWRVSSSNGEVQCPQWRPQIQIQRGGVLFHQRRDPGAGGLLLGPADPDGGKPSKCGWLKDRFGLSWQVVPKALGRYLSDPDRKKANRIMQAMMKMGKIVIADLDKAHTG